jgi:hypothetical protein
MSTLAQYDRARAALAQAVQIDDVIPLLDEFELAKLRAKQIKDQALLADATEFQLRAERRLGEIITAAKAAGLFRQGRQHEKKSGGDFIERPTLTEAGIDTKLSSRAQSRASISEQAFENMVNATRERIASGKAKIIEADLPAGARSIMGSRQEPDESLDFFPTPPWATRALVEEVLGAELGYVWEPACGEGHMAEVLREYSIHIRATDIFDYGYGIADVDFLTQDDNTAAGTDWIITNPPFGDLTEKFTLRAIELAKIGVAMFVRLQWLESVGRYETIFKDHPPTCIAFFAERVPLCKGEWKPDGTTATAYIWLVWIKGQEPRSPFWIPPGQRERLTKPDDAARFTSHPVIRKEDYDPATGEVRITSESRTNHKPESVPDSVGTDARQSSASVSEPASDHPPSVAGAGSPSYLPEIILPGVAPTFEHIAAFTDLTNPISARAS